MSLKYTTHFEALINKLPYSRVHIGYFEMIFLID